MTNTFCIFCTRPRPFDTPFCNNCYFALPYDLRKFLYRRPDDGFEGALEAALEWLTDKYGERINVSKNSA